jgi:hypothetical protein
VGADDAAALLKNVNEIAAPGAPGPLCVFGEQAFVIATGKVKERREAVVAATRWGNGRVVAFGHDGFLNPGEFKIGDTAKLMVNAIRWAGGKASEGEGPRVAVTRNLGLVAALQKLGLKATALDTVNWQEKLNPCDVVICGHDALAPENVRAALEKFIKDGGGLVAGSLGWGWAQTHPKQNLVLDHPGNRLLMAAGIVWADGTLERTTKDGFETKEPVPELVHAGKALALLQNAASTKPSAKELAQAAGALTLAARALPPDESLFLPKLQKLTQESAANAIPTAKKPLRTKTDAVARLVLTLQLEALKRQAPEQVKAHPAAAEFPGSVQADAPRVKREVAIDTKVPDWHSTGLYAAPGELLTVTIPENAAGKGLQVRIGAHRDHLWELDSWSRCPEITLHRPLNAMETKIASAFGGPVYIEVPYNCALGEVKVSIGGAVEMPYYVLGKTDLTAWRNEIRLRKAPWAELQAKKVILTVPAEVVRSLEEPEELMKFWDVVLDCCAELACRPLERERPERYVTDMQISAGYMHSGYPIMTHLDAAKPIVDKTWMLTKDEPTWGFYHEMGHNHQSGDWTFGGTGEVTVNLFTRYCMEKASGVPIEKQRVQGKQAAEMVRKHIAAGADFEKWKSDPFLALTMYDQLQKAFGWDAFKKVFTVYRDLPQNARPKNDAEKRDQWMVRFSQAVGKNLGPFFQAWGVPTSEQARASIAALSAWMPEGFPETQATK